MISPGELWATVLADLRRQLPRAAYDSVLAGSELERTGAGYRLLAPSQTALEWQEGRLKEMIQSTFAGLLGQPVSLEFGLRGGHAPTPETDSSAYLPLLDPVDSAAPTPGQIVAAADYICGYLEGDRAAKIRPTGYSQVPHPVSYFHLPLLGPAFSLYKILEADDKRSLKSIAPNYWSLPLRYSFQQLAQKLNKKHHRYASGDVYECDHSRQARRQGRPLTCPDDCCHSAAYEWLWHKAHPAGGLQCLHWVMGQLERLCEVGLARVELRPGEYKPVIHLWRMLPLITPYEYRSLSPQLQTDFDAWLLEYGPQFNAPHPDFWRAITEPHLAPLMPAYLNEQIKHNWYDQYPRRRLFFGYAFRNPAFEAEELT